jgi:hypothetical protein
VLAVGNTEFTPPGPFELSVSILPLPTNVTCATAIAVTDGSTVSGNTDIGGSDMVSCARLSNPLYYSATIPAGHTIGAEITSSLPVEAGILSGCGGSCLASSTRTSASTFVSRTNTGTTPVSVILAVGRPTFSLGGPFAMRVSIQPASMNVTCATATVVGDGDSLALQDARAGLDDLSALCEPSPAPGGALYYRATVPPGETIGAAMTPAEGWRAVLRILPACGATSCLAWSPLMFGGATASWTNTGTTSTDVILAASASNTTSTGYFRLDVAIGPPPYAESSVAASCDDVSAGTAVSGVLGDNSYSPTLALPFTAPFFRASMTHFQVTTNGVLHLWPSASAPQPFGAASGNTPLPTANQPNSMVAALWDDLFAPTGSAVRTQELGTGADRRVVFEWSGFQFDRVVDSMLTFQVKLFESGVVEIHYCDLTPGTDPSRATGGSATVGLENALGTHGTQHSHNMPGSIGTTDALRFTPVP